MDWAIKMIYPIIKDCETPEEAEIKIMDWSETVHPRDSFCGLIIFWMIQRDWQKFKLNNIKNNQK